MSNFAAKRKRSNETRTHEEHPFEPQDGTVDRPVGYISSFDTGACKIVETGDPLASRFARLTPMKIYHGFLTGNAMASALFQHPHLTLMAYNQMPELSESQLSRVMDLTMRTCATPTSDEVVDALKCTQFIRPDTYVQLLRPLLGQTAVHRLLAFAISALRTSGAAPLPVRVPIAVSDDISDSASVLRPMLFVPDDSDACSGWLITAERWEGRIGCLETAPPGASMFLRGLAFKSYLSCRPDLSLSTYNQMPTLTSSLLPLVMMRTTVVPTASDTVVDALMCTLPFTFNRKVSNLEPVLGVTGVHMQLASALAALRTSGAAPLPVRVPIAMSDGISDSASILRPMLFVPDESNHNSGWLITAKRWECQIDRTLLPVTVTTKFLRGRAFKSAMSCRPDFSLNAYNQMPTLTTSLLPRVMMRTSVVPTVTDSVVDALMCTIPFIDTYKVSNLEPVLGVTTIHVQLASAMSALRTSGAAPIPVRVPIAVSDGISVSASVLRPMLFVPDESNNSGWLMTAELWECKCRIDRLLPVTVTTKVLCGLVFKSAMSCRPDLTLVAYNQAPTLTISQLPRVMLRTIVSNTAFDTVVDALCCTLPFIDPTRVSHLVPVLGVTQVHMQLAVALAALRTSGTAPLLVRVPIAVSDGPSASSASVFRPMLFMPDKSNHNSGWLITAERWECRIDRMLPVTVTTKLLRGLVFKSAMSCRPDLTLEAYNQAPKLTLSQLFRVALRTIVSPTASNTVVDALCCTLPFIDSVSVSHLEPVLGLTQVHNQLAAALSALRTSRAAPLPVRVPIAVSDVPSDSVSVLRPMLFVPDGSDDSGWLITAELWEGRLNRIPTVITQKLLRGLVFKSATSRRPDLTLAAYNQAPKLTLTQLPRVMMRAIVSPTVSETVVDARCCTLPFTDSVSVSHLEPVLGLTQVHVQLAIAMSALRTSGAAPLHVRVPIAVSNVPSDSVSVLRPMLFVPDSSDDSGWLITAERWEGRLDRIPTFITQNLLRGLVFKSATSRRPDLTLAAYNQAPTLTISQLPRVMMRTIVLPTASNTVVDTRCCTLPFIDAVSVSHLGPVLGLTQVHNQLAAALSALRTSGSATLHVRVPIAVSDGPSDSSASILRHMLFVPDAGGTISGWLISVKRWEGYFRKKLADGRTVFVDTSDQFNPASLPSSAACAPSLVPVQQHAHQHTQHTGRSQFASRFDIHSCGVGALAQPMGVASHFHDEPRSDGYAETQAAPFTSDSVSRAPYIAHLGYVRTIDPYAGCGSLAPRNEPDVRGLLRAGTLWSHVQVPTGAECGDVM